MTRSLHVLLTEEEHTALRRLAVESGFDVSSIVRSKIADLLRQPPEIEATRVKELMLELPHARRLR